MSLSVGMSLELNTNSNLILLKECLRVQVWFHPRATGNTGSIIIYFLFMCLQVWFQNKREASWHLSCFHLLCFHAIHTDSCIVPGVVPEPACQVPQAGEAAGQVPLTCNPHLQRHDAQHLPLHLARLLLPQPAQRQHHEPLPPDEHHLPPCRTVLRHELHAINQHGHAQTDAATLHGNGL